MGRRWLKGILLVLTVAFLLLAGFFFWASSSTLDEADYAYTTDYATPSAPPSDTLTVITYNIGYLSGMTNNRPLERTEAFMEDNLNVAAESLCNTQADVIAFQEIDFAARRSHDVQQLNALAKRCGFAASASVVNWDERYVPFPSANPLMHFGRTVSGQAVLSRYPILRQERIALARPATPFYYDAFYLDRLAQVVAIDVGRPLALINVHLEAWDETTRERQAEAVRGLYQKLVANQPTLLLGDFNSELTTARQKHREDQAISLLLEGTNLRAALPDPSAATLTYPADVPTVKIDHIFYDPAQMSVLEARVLETATPPSDHRALLVRLAFKK
ncbi:MAG TPA: endonuclease/exonuclease/phosphatase family protein [Rhodothermales bacterium]|nr:endonuclease/exonuclease/phosphatase family protein [Rhodothermales bacterium]